jgi:hypothetical protein
MGKTGTYWGRTELQGIYSVVEQLRQDYARKKLPFDPQKAFLEEFERMTGGKVVGVQMRDTTDVEVRLHGGNYSNVVLRDVKHNHHGRDAGITLAHVVQHRSKEDDYKLLIPQPVVCKAAHTGKILETQF